MQRPANITFRGMAPSEAVEARIRDKIAWLENFFDGIIGCDVVVDSPHRHSRKRRQFSVTIEMRVPGGPPIFAGRPHHDDPGSEDVYVAMRNTFNAARRLLQDYARKLRGHVKTHEIPPHGRVRWINDGKRYGFIDASDGTEVYFHENSLVDIEFDELSAGDEVRFAIHPGEGADGPQASTVHRIGKHHLAP